MRSRAALAWLVHLYTASGLVLAALAVALGVRGDAESLRLALLLLVAANVVDATDGWLARRADVARATPGFDGRRLDDIVDFLTYTAVPLFLVWRSGVLAPASPTWLLLPLVTSAYGFAQVDAKTSDGYFLGFPSYWNVVALYLVELRPPGEVGLLGLIALSLLTFVPARYLYPSQPGRLNRATAALGAMWGSVVVLALLRVFDAPRAWLLASLAFPAWYLGASWVVTVRRWHGR